MLIGNINMPKRVEQLTGIRILIRLTIYVCRLEYAYTTNKKCQDISSMLSQILICQENHKHDWNTMKSTCLYKTRSINYRVATIITFENT